MPATPKVGDRFGFLVLRLRHPEVIGFETLLRRLDGSTFWARINSTLIRDVEGRPVRLGGVIEDIDARKDAEQRFGRAFNCSASGMALAVPGGRFLDANKTFQSLLGYSHDELLAMTWEDVTAPEDWELSRRLIDNVLAGAANTIDIEKRYLRRDGSIMWGRVSAALTHRSDGKPREAIIQLSDITAAHELSERLDAEVRARVNLISQFVPGR